MSASTGEWIGCLQTHRLILMAQRLESSFAYPRIGGHVSDNLSGGTSDRGKIAWIHNFPRVKLEWTERI